MEGEVTRREVIKEVKVIKEVEVEVIQKAEGGCEEGGWRPGIWMGSQAANGGAFEGAFRGIFERTRRCRRRWKVIAGRGRNGRCVQSRA